MTRDTLARVRKRAVGEWWPRLLDIIFPRTLLERSVPLLTTEGLYGSSPRAPETKDADIHALFAYANPKVRALIWLLKYRGNRAAIRLAAEALFDAIVGDIAEEAPFRGGEIPIIVPIPLGAGRLRERGFNQMSRVLYEMSLRNPRDKKFFEPREDVLKKVKDTKPQTRIKDKGERIGNLAGCFAVADDAAIAGKRVIVVDDVTTTGATFREARDTLLAAGAASVVCYAVAH